MDVATVGARFKDEPLSQQRIFDTFDSSKVWHRLRKLVKILL